MIDKDGYKLGVFMGFAISFVAGICFWIGMITDFLIDISMVK